MKYSLLLKQSSKAARVTMSSSYRRLQIGDGFYHKILLHMKNADGLLETTLDVRCLGSQKKTLNEVKEATSSVCVTHVTCMCCDLACAMTFPVGWRSRRAGGDGFGC